MVIYLSTMVLRNTFVVTAASGNTAISGTLSATGDFKVNTDKFVVTAVKRQYRSSWNIGVTGATTLSNTLTVSGSNATTLGGTLGVSGATTLTMLILLLKMEVLLVNSVNCRKW